MMFTQRLLTLTKMTKLKKPSHKEGFFDIMKKTLEGESNERT